MKTVDAASILSPIIIPKETAVEACASYIKEVDPQTEEAVMAIALAFRRGSEFANDNICRILNERIRKALEPTTL